MKFLNSKMSGCYIPTIGVNRTDLESALLQRRDFTLSSLRLQYLKMVKEKPNSTRTYDEDGFRRRAACLCVKDEQENEVLLVTSSRAPERWIVPGGGLEPNEEPSVAAIREVVEEAGVRGHLGRCLGTFENPERKHRTSVFVLVVTEELDEWEDSKSIGRKRKWFPIDEALDLLSIHKPIQCSYLKLLTRNDKVP